jgi:hypothetical protein
MSTIVKKEPTASGGITYGGISSGIVTNITTTPGGKERKRAATGATASGANGRKRVRGSDNIPAPEQAEARKVLGANWMNYVIVPSQVYHSPYAAPEHRRANLAYRFMASHSQILPADLYAEYAAFSEAVHFGRPLPERSYQAGVYQDAVREGVTNPYQYVTVQIGQHSLQSYESALRTWEYQHSSHIV